MEKPDLILTYTIKPTLYCSIAAKIFKIPIINNITGLGSSFIDNNWLTNIIIFMYRFSLSKSHLIFFQNKDDCALFREKRILNNQKFDVIPGSGINMNFFKVDRGIQIKNKDDFIFLMISRVMRDKGVVEFVDAAKMIKKSRPNIKFKILGEIDLSANSGISASKINLWKSESDVEFLGKVEDVKDYISRSSCVVLPSYREGLPRALLEASALEKPIVATDVPGCRDVVDDGMNGYLCTIKDHADLAEKMIRVVLLSNDMRAAMGVYGRKKVKAEFNETIVINKYANAIASLKK